MRRIAFEPRRSMALVRDKLALRPKNSNQQWCRTVLDRSIDEFLRRRVTPTLSAVEVSGREILDRHEWKMAVELAYPEFDLCEPPEVLEQFDVVICNQVLEHIVNPWQGVKTLAALCRPRGFVVIGTPFMLRVHEHPLDLWRFTPSGLSRLLTS